MVTRRLVRRWRIIPSRTRFSLAVSFAPLFVFIFSQSITDVSSEIAAGSAVDGRVLRWSRKNGDTTRIDGDIHSNALVRILGTFLSPIDSSDICELFRSSFIVTAVHKSTVITVAKDDSVRYAEINGPALTYNKVVTTKGTPQDAAVSPSGHVVVVTSSGIQVFFNGVEEAHLETKEELTSPRGGGGGVAASVGYAPKAVAFCCDNETIAVGADETIGGHRPSTLRVLRLCCY